MKAVVFHGVGDIRLDDVREPHIQEPTDAIVRITASAICGTDLHVVRGTLGGMKPGTILGHEAVGVVEEVGRGVRNLRRGDRVVVPSTIACGSCVYCRCGYTSQCDTANPHGPRAGSAFFGGPASSGPFPGLQAQFARVPFAHVGLVRLPPEVPDDQAILLSDIFPTGWFAARLAEVKQGDVVAVFGCGPVGMFAIASAFLQGAARVLAVDRVSDRLEIARGLGAEVIDFEHEDPLKAIEHLTDGIGPDRAIDAVGVDAEPASRGPGKPDRNDRRHFREELEAVVEKGNGRSGGWAPGRAPSQVLRWSLDCLAKAGTLSIIGVYPETMEGFPLGKAMEKNLTVKMGNCNHRRYIPQLLRLVQRGEFDPSQLVTRQDPLLDAIAAYEHFDRREAGWLKVELLPSAAPAVANGRTRVRRPARSRKRRAHATA
jgi:threonine dehydrogenase-like Zn-dependent dehydrogenase